MQSGLLLFILRTSSPVSSPFRSILAGGVWRHRSIGRTCLSDTVGHLSIEIVGRGEAAAKVGEGVNIVEDLAIDLSFRRVRCWSLCRLKHHFSLLDAYCESKALIGHTQGEFVSLWRSFSEWATIAQSSAYRKSRTSDLVTFVFVFRRWVLKIPPSVLYMIWIPGYLDLSLWRQREASC